LSLAVISEELLVTGTVGSLPEESVGMGSVALESVGFGVGVEVAADEAGVVGVVVALAVARVTMGRALASTFSKIIEPSIPTIEPVRVPSMKVMVPTTLPLMSVTIPAE
jgi:hypothetical protein